MSEAGQAVRQILADLVGTPINPAELIKLNPSSYIDPVQANTVYFGSPQGPLTPANLDRPQLLAVQIQGARSGAERNIGALGGNMAVASGFWKFTAIIRAGDRSKSTSVVWAGTPDLTLAKNNGIAWCNVLKPMLGNSGSATSLAAGESAQSPMISYLRVSDAQSPRIGELFDVRSLNMVGAGGIPPNNGAADYLGSALAIRLACATTVVPIKTVYSNHGFVGVPDGVISQGDQFIDQYPYGTSVFATYLQSYLNYITNGTNALGCMTTDELNQPKKHTGLWNDTDGVWKVSLPGHGYVNGDRIRVSAANARFFNGSYVVTGVTPLTPDVFAIARGPVLGIPGPTTAIVQRIQLASGVRPNIFAAFKAPAGGWVTPFGIKVSGRRPGRRFNPVSFRSRPRRPHS